MRNLELLRSFPLLELDGTEEPFCLTVDCDCGIVYTATATGITGFQPSSQEVSCICTSGMQIASEMCAVGLKLKEKEVHTKEPWVTGHSAPKSINP